MNVLSSRLRTIADLIPVGARVADIGSDHGYLPTYLVQSGKCDYIIAGEINDGPYRSTLKQIQFQQLESFVQVRKGNGLEVLHQDEVDTVVIAGMGGSLIAQILQDGEEQLSGIQLLLLQPNNGEAHIREFALEHGWELVDEQLIEEDNRIYEILVLRRGDARKPYRNQWIPHQMLLKLGPILIEKKEPLFYKKWHRELKNIERVIGQLKRASTADVQAKLLQMESEYTTIKEILK